MSVLTFDISQSHIPHFSEWVGLWAMQERAFDSLVGLVSRLDLASHLSRQQELAAAGAASGSGYRTDRDGVAIVQLRGTLMKQQLSFGQATSTVMARRDIRSAVQSSDIGAIMILFDSPGGSVSGTAELAADIRDAAAIKPVIAYAEDLCASAAYWGASQAPQIFANELALLGSIGTYAMVVDSSAQAAQQGVKVNVVKSAGATHKAVGVPGVAVSDEQLAEMQQLINSRQEFFSAAVAAGRKMTRMHADSLATGQVWSAKDAKAVGLIDDVMSFDAAFAKAKAAATDFLQTGRKPNGATMTKPKASMSAQESSDVIERYRAAIVQIRATDNCTEAAAAHKLRRTDWPLVQAYIAAANTDRPHLIESTVEKTQTQAYFARLKELQKQGKSKSEAAQFIAIHESELHQAMLAEVQS